MYALKVSINDESPVIGGAEDMGVLSAHVTCTGVLGSKSHPSRADETQDFTFRLGGLTCRAPGNQNEHLIWMQRWDLKVGDKLNIEIVRAEEANDTISETEAAQAESDEREYFEHVKKAYLELRSKYEPEA